MEPNFPNFPFSQDYSNPQYQNPQFFQQNQLVITENSPLSQKTQKGEKWETREDVALMKVWCEVSENKTRGKNQKKKSIWIAVKELYDAARAENPEGLSARNENQLKGCWGRLNERVNKWVAAYNEAYRQQRSGMNMTDVERETHVIYEAGGSKFNESTVFYEVVRFHPKWQLEHDRGTTHPDPEHEVEDEESHGSTKRTRTTEDGEYIAHASQEIPTGGGSSIQRPTGRDAAKRKGKGKASQSASSNDFSAELHALKITKASHLELMREKFEYEKERDKKDAEMKILDHDYMILNTLMGKAQLTEAEEMQKQALWRKLYGTLF